MSLNKINFPADLKKLPIKDLKTLAAQIREMIVDVVSERGGHLASSLGAVELCVALHYSLNAPEDSILFDVGHQAYAHKILTGRKDIFNSLRTYNGLSGFPNCEESVYDTYTSGHASTAVSWAQGIAEAKKIKGDKSKTVAVIGDGSLTGGMCFEALNNCGHCQSDVLIIYNHNEMSISPSVGALSSYMTKFLSAPIYNRVKTEFDKFIKNLPFGSSLAKHAGKFEEAMKGLLVPGIFFEELGFRYFGPIDGHDMDMLIKTLKNISVLGGPKVLHIVTKKGKGHNLAEINPEDFHSASAENKRDNDTAKKITFSEVFGQALLDLGKRDERVVAITAAMPKATGLDKFKEAFPDKFYDVGIAEGHAVGFASGLAKQGFRPVVAIYSTFLQRAFDQIIHDVALQNCPVIFVLDRSGLVGADGPTHHGVFDISYLRLVPNMVCMAPKDKIELTAMLDFAVTLDCPVSIRYPRDNAYTISEGKKIMLGKSEVLCVGANVCILAIGSMVKVAKDAAEMLNKKNINVSVINARFIKPLDDSMLTEIVKTHSVLIILEENSVIGGFGSAVMEFYESKGLLDQITVVRKGIPDKFIPAGSREKLFDFCGIDSESVADTVSDLYLTIK
ncbi:MAG: 1-deoxy-D-xylulose-5-phosphate synthase [Candidatus Omnitrophica bacterium]|nr:1-deoxy-D-xylulose-5-phosphate synthase [Candidatus Omnitrophota bacterium]